MDVTLMDRPPRAPCLFVEDGVCLPRGRGDPPVGSAPPAFDDNHVGGLLPASRAVVGRANPPRGVERCDRVAARKTIALHRPSVFLLLRGTICLWWRTPPEGN